LSVESFESLVSGGFVRLRAVLTRAFGLSLSFETSPPGAWEARPAGELGLRLCAASREEIAAQWSGCDAVGWEARIDGAPFVAERGRDGDYRFAHGERSLHFLAADGQLLRSALAEGEGPASWRVLLDSVLFSVALIRGREALHAGAVATERGAVAIVAGSGGGKSTLLAELLRGGGTLLSDDVVVLEPGVDGAPLAHPGPPLMTVPAPVRPLPGEPIAALGEERWVAVPVAPEPIPLAAVVLLNRHPGAATGLRALSDPLAVLLASLLAFPRTPERERARFELAAEIAARVPIWELAADPAVAPATLAHCLLAGL
jgi:hypothetical protein